MKVYVLVGENWHEASETLAVFESKDEAEANKKEFENMNAGVRFDGYSIYEHDLIFKKK